MSATVEIVVRYRDSSGAERKKTAEGLEGIGDAADSAKGKLGGFQQIATGALRKIGEFAVSSLASAGMAVAGFVGDAVKGGMDYQESMNMFQASTGATADQMSTASDLAKKLGGDLTLPSTSAADAGEAMTELAKAGLTVNDTFAASKGTLQLAAAGNLENAQAAEIAANALNTFHLEGKEAPRLQICWPARPMPAVWKLPIWPQLSNRAARSSQVSRGRLLVARQR